MKIKVIRMYVVGKFHEDKQILDAIKTFDELNEHIKKIARCCRVPITEVYVDYEQTEPFVCTKCGLVLNDRNAEAKPIPKLCKKCETKK